MFIAAAISLLITMAIALTRLFIGPSLYDRIMAVNMFGTKMVLLIAVAGFLAGRPDFLDIALAYALINFTGMIAILKYFRYWMAPRSGESDAESPPVNAPGAG